MGQFSWIYSDTCKQMIDGKVADSYLLVPKPFQGKYGKAIHESCYEGYGMFGGYDVYELITEWNKDMIPEIVRKIKNGNKAASAAILRILTDGNLHGRLTRKRWRSGQKTESIVGALKKQRKDIGMSF